MSQLPYSPMNQVPLATEADQLRMKRLLEKHAKPKAEVMSSDRDAGAVGSSGPSTRSVTEGASASSENTLPKVKWEKLNDWYMRSECGNYRCRKYIPDEVRVGDHNDQPKYQLEYKVGELWFYRLGPPFDSWPEARKAAQAHFESRAGEPKR